MAAKPRIKKMGKYFYIGINIKDTETGKIKWTRIQDAIKHINEKDAKKELKKWQAKYELGLSKESDIKNQGLTFKNVLDEYLVTLKQDVAINKISASTERIFKEKIIHARPIYYEPIKDIRYQKQKELISTLIDQKLSHRSINMTRQAIKKVFDFAQKMEYIEHQLMVEPLPLQQKEKSILTKKQLESVFYHTKTKIASSSNQYKLIKEHIEDFTEIEFIVKVAYYHCLRAKDWFYMTWNDVDFEKNVINVPATAKNKLKKRVPIHPETLEIMKHFKKIATNEYMNPLLDPRRPHLINYDYLNKRINRLGKRANLPFRLNLTVIRATSATHYAESGQLSAIELNQLFGIQADMTEKDKKLIEFTGHTNTKTTSEHYVDVMASKDNQKALNVKVRKALK